MTREELLGRYYLLTENLLPHDAYAYIWEIWQPQQFQRVLLDFLFEDAWENHLDRQRVVYEQLTDADIEHLISLAEYMLAGGAARVTEMNNESLRWRGKLPD